MPIDVEKGKEKLKYNQYNFCCNGRVWCVRETSGAVCVFVAYFFIAYAAFVIVYIIIIPNPCWIFKTFNFIGYIAILILAVSSHLRGMLTDPGAVPVLEKPVVGNDEKLCAKCGCVKPPKAHHCSVCRRCIRRMDHHCPWMNNCVGEDNLKFFILYNFYIAALCFYTMVLVVFKFIGIFEIGWYNPKNSTFEVIAVSVALVKALAFSAFTIGIGVSQVMNIVNDTTYIEKLQKNNVTGAGSKCGYYRAVMGNTFFDWFSPFTKIEKEQSKSRS